MAMTIKPQSRPLRVPAFLAFVLAANCGQAEGIHPGDGSVAADVIVDAGQESTLDAAQDGSDPGPLPSTASLFLTIDNMEERTDLPGIPANVGGFWWSLGEGVVLGNWFVAVASDGERGPHRDALPDSIAPPRGDSLRARHVQSSGHAGGSDLYAQLQHLSSRAVDLSPYLGISFWAKLSGPSHRLIVALQDDRGGPILTAESADSHFVRAIAVSEQWERFILLFDDFHQGMVSGSGSGKAFTADAVSTIDFVVGLEDAPFDLWIDDLALLCRGVCRARSL